MDKYVRHAEEVGARQVKGQPEQVECYGRSAVFAQVGDWIVIDGRGVRTVVPDAVFQACYSPMLAKESSDEPETVSAESSEGAEAAESDDVGPDSGEPSGGKSGRRRKSGKG